MSTLAAVLRKRKTGKPLTKEEEELFRSYIQEQGARSVRVYFPSEKEIERFQRLAEADGIKSFSKWVILKLEEAASRSHFSKEYVEQLRRDREMLEKWYQVEKEKVAKLEREKDDMNRRIQALAEKLAGVAKKEGK